MPIPPQRLVELPTWWTRFWSFSFWVSANLTTIGDEHPCLNIKETKRKRMKMGHIREENETLKRFLLLSGEWKRIDEVSADEVTRRV